jgi:hypothetical protein
MQADIPLVPITTDDEALGRVSIIAGEYAGHKGAALTWTPLNLWDVVIDKFVAVSLSLCFFSPSFPTYCVSQVQTLESRVRMVCADGAC